MSLAFRRIKVYFKLTLIVLVACAVGLVLWKNRDREVGVWFLWLTDPNKTVNVVWLMLCSGGGTLLSYWILRTVFGVWAEMRSVAHESALRALTQEHAEQSKQAERSKKLEARDKGLDEVTKKAISEES